MTTDNQIYRYDIFSLLSHAFIYNLRQRDCFKKVKSEHKLTWIVFVNVGNCLFC